MSETLPDENRCISHDQCLDGFLCIQIHSGEETGECLKVCDPEFPDCQVDHRCISISESVAVCIHILYLHEGIGEQCPGGTVDCSSGICVVTERGNLCALPCQYDAECPTVARCEETVDLEGYETSVCMPVGATGFSEEGEPCPNGSIDCLSRICIQFEDRQICSKSCRSNKDCSEGLECRMHEEYGESVCSFPLLPFGSYCSSNRQCQSSICIEKNLCSSPCEDSEDCPEGWRCKTSEEFDSEVCYPLGSIGEECQRGVEDCISGLCLWDENRGSGVCTERCQTSEDCPTGWICVTVRDSRGNPIDVCYPTE